MFISIRWKAIILLSVILFFITLGWVVRSVYVNLENYQTAVSEDEVRFQNILDQLISDNFLKLSQYAQLISDYPYIKNANAGDQRRYVQDKLTSNWFDLNLSIGVDYIAVIGESGSQIVSAHQFSNKQAADRFKSAIDIFAFDIKHSRVQNFVFCDTHCSQIVTEPFFFANGKKGYIVIGQSMSELVGRYHAISEAELAIMIKRPNHSNESKYFRNWKGHLWAASNFNETYNLLQDFSAQNTDLKNIYYEESLLDQWENDYRVNKLLPADYFQVGYPVVYINIINNQTQKDLLKADVINQVLAGLVGWLFAVILLILALFGPIQRIMRVVKALSFLPSQNYEKAKQSIHVNDRKTYDEIGELENSTLELSGKLEELQYEIDLSKSKLEEQVLTVTRSKDFLQRLFDNAHLFIVTQDSLYTINQTNNYFNEFFSAGIGASFATLLKGEKEKRYFIKNGVDLLNGKLNNFQQDTWLGGRGYEEVYVAWTHTLVESEHGDKQILSIGIDITQRKKDEYTLQWLADNDSLTQIGNRRVFHDSLKRLLKQNFHGAVVFIDVNRFKQINDIYGHVVGDNVLVDIAERLKSHIRENDIVCRLAGDEFTLILTGVNQQGLQTALEHLSKKIGGRLNLEDGRAVDYTASFGAALFPEHGADEQSLIVHSDMAMYQAKKKGLNHWHIFDFSDDSLQTLKNEHHLMNIIKQALKENSFKLEYQPIMGVKSYSVSHYEALLRLQDDQGNAISPSEFIPVAERVGLINELDIWVFNNVMQFIAGLSTEKSYLKFSVNVSAPSLQDAMFGSKIINLSNHFNVSPQRIIIELTETAYIDNLHQVMKNLEFLDSKGFAIALDDFGVGFSSFSYMKQLPLTYVKLDGIYTQKLLENEENRAFVESVVIMANAFGMQTIAEYVQEEDDLHVLENIGIDYIQGFLTGMSAEKLLKTEQEADLKQSLHKPG